jgi:N-acyl-D-aspartate/D-glutamate deacylase
VADLLIRGGFVIDGLGQPATRADVRVRAGRIAEIAKELRSEGEPELDAADCFVTPGFIDTHTHFDPTLFWDRTCDPMPQHGVTSVLVGNCSLSLAPVRGEHRSIVSELFGYVEDLPAAALERVPFAWESYDRYLSVLDVGGAAVNVATLVGHNMLRMYVLGDDAWMRASTREETDRISALLDECLAVGAFGMSTSLGFDEDRSGRPVPSRLADDVELDALIERLASRSRILQFIPTPGFGRLKRDVSRIASLTGPRGVVSTWINIFYDAASPDLANDLLDFASALQESGVPTYPQVSPRPLDIQVNWNGGMAFGKMPDAWHPMVQAGASEKREMLRDPGWRSRARAEWDAVPWAMLPHKYPERVRFVSVTNPRDREWVGATLADLVAVRQGHPADVLANFVLENDLRPGVVGVGVANSDASGVAATLLHPASIVSNSDAGAHLRMMCAVGDSTLLLTRHVRERGDMTIEAAVCALTSRQAELFGFADRGVLRPGAHADLVIFDLDELSWHRDEMIEDLPEGGSRLRRPAGGYRATVVSGVATQIDGKLTSALPAHVLRRQSSTDH